MLTPIISPRTRGLYFASPFKNRSPFLSTSGRIFSITPIVARAAAHASGPPANVLPCSLFLNSRSSLATSAPIGKPLAIPFASVTISGFAFVCWIASHFPVRPMPVWTSSAIMRAPVVSQISRIPSKKVSGGIMTPASPWIGSTMNACGIVVHHFFQPFKIAVFNKRAFKPEGFKGFTDRRFVRDCKRTDCPSVEPVGKRNKFFLPGPDTGELQCTIDCFCPGIGEERFVHAGNFDKFLCKVSLVGHIIQVGAMDEFMCLVADRFNYRRVAMSRAADGNTCYAVDIFLTFRIPDR